MKKAGIEHASNVFGKQRERMNEESIVEEFLWKFVEKKSSKPKENMYFWVIIEKKSKSTSQKPNYSDQQVTNHPQYLD